MNLEDVKDLMEYFETSDLATLELSIDDVTLKLSKSCKPSASAPVYDEEPRIVERGVKEIPTPAEGTAIIAPLVGTFYRAKSPDAEPFVEVGQEVKAGQVVCLVEAMKVMNEIKAPCAGRVASIAAKNGEMVAYGAILMEIAG